MLIFRAFRRDDTPEIANLKTDEAYTVRIKDDCGAGGMRLIVHRFPPRLGRR
jgi:hypothetical protein